MGFLAKRVNETDCCFFSIQPFNRWRQMLEEGQSYEIGGPSMVEGKQWSFGWS